MCLQKKDCGKKVLAATGSDKFDKNLLAELAYIKPSQQVFFTEGPKADTFRITVGGKTTAEFGREDAERLGSGKRRKLGNCRSRLRPSSVLSAKTR